MGDRGDDRALASPAAPARLPDHTGPPPSPDGHDRHYGEDHDGHDDIDDSASPNGGSTTPQLDRPMASLAARSHSKRALDLGLTLLALPVVAVLCLLIAFLVAITSRGPVLFRQERVGLDGKRFRLVKFRTMGADAEDRLYADSQLLAQYRDNDFKLPAGQDDRVTPVGRFLRRSSLDELPQLVNVLRGHMSLVGPRPIVPEETERYGRDLDVYLSVRPGITGTWQVNGRSGVGYPDRIVFDREYARSWTFWLDVRILLKTPLAVISRRGAH